MLICYELSELDLCWTMPSVTIGILFLMDIHCAKSFATFIITKPLGGMWHMIELQFRYKMVDLVELFKFEELARQKKKSEVLCVRKAVLKLVFLTSRLVLMAYFPQPFSFCLFILALF